MQGKMFKFVTLLGTMALANVSFEAGWMSITDFSF
jgi:hypothetical protein